ncbi:MAG: hypothetical protein PVG65_05755 [Candidatus Thorarchaeota archaeon]|jgi:hypothetical protein
MLFITNKTGSLRVLLDKHNYVLNNETVKKAEKLALKNKISEFRIVRRDYEGFNDLVYFGVVKGFYQKVKKLPLMDKVMGSLIVSFVTYLTLMI